MCISIRIYFYEMLQQINSNHIYSSDTIIDIELAAQQHMLRENSAHK